MIDSTGTVGIGTTFPASSAGLDVKFTDKGFLPPRMTETQRDAISSPVAGLVVWCTNCGPSGELQVNNGSTWTNMIGGTAAAPLAIGDFHAGGIIFYLDGTGGGKVCATADQSTGIQWTTSAFHSTTVPGGATSTTDGLANSNAIVAQTGAPAANTYAAGLCRLYSAAGDGGLLDWYLPAKDELNLMYQNIGQGNALGLGNVGGFANLSYWSSTEYGNYVAWLQYFSNGFQNVNYKNLTYRVRAVRAF
ncbi:MAG: DUF1566 domain-containing protein [Gammaproteobacteria bacterium]|nr:DUF1566 domain-containing protein [Gammaproteobacteria bacterium]